MTKKTRLIILLVCVACFLIAAPFLVLYSMGYRYDFQKMKITETGGIYVRTFPAADGITIDSKIFEKPGMFSNWIFVQSLLPDNHTVSITKAGYYDYNKTLPVIEEQVTKLENVLLFKNDIRFTEVTNATGTQNPFNTPEKFVIKTNNLYYSAAPENLSLTPAQKATPVLKSILAFSVVNNNIIWLGADGFLYKADLPDIVQKNVKSITIEPLKIPKKSSYKIIANGQNVFVIANGELLILNQKITNFENFYAPVADAKISPDGKNIIYYNDENIYLSPISLAPPITETSLYAGKVTDFAWLNNDYIIFTAGDKIIISEIDFRGNINSVTLPQTAAISAAKKIDIMSPKIFFSQQDGKLYVLTGKTLLLSERIIP